MEDKYLELKKLIPDEIAEEVSKEVFGKTSEEEEDRGIYGGGYRKKLSRKKRKRIKKTKRFKHKKNKSKRRKLRNHKYRKRTRRVQR